MITYRPTAATLRVYLAPDGSVSHEERQVHLVIDPPHPVAEDGVLHAADRALVSLYSDGQRRVSLFEGDAHGWALFGYLTAPPALIAAAEAAVAHLRPAAARAYLTRVDAGDLAEALGMA